MGIWAKNHQAQKQKARNYLVMRGGKVTVFQGPKPKNRLAGSPATAGLKTPDGQFTEQVTNFESTFREGRWETTQQRHAAEKKNGPISDESRQHGNFWFHLRCWKASEHPTEHDKLKSVYSVFFVAFSPPFFRKSSSCLSANFVSVARILLLDFEKGHLVSYSAWLRITNHPYFHHRFWAENAVQFVGFPSGALRLLPSGPELSVNCGSWVHRELAVLDFDLTEAQDWYTGCLLVYLQNWSGFCRQMALLFLRPSLILSKSIDLRHPQFVHMCSFVMDFFGTRRGFSPTCGHMTWVQVCFWRYPAVWIETIWNTQNDFQVVSMKHFQSDCPQCPYSSEVAKCT